MRTLLIAVLLQALTAPDPAQMETAPDLGYRPVDASWVLPEGMSMGAPSSVAVDRRGHLIVFNRGAHPLMEFDAAGKFVRAFGEGRYVRPHGMRLDGEGNIWTTDVTAHTVTKMNARGEVLLVLGAPGLRGLINEPTDVAIGPAGEIYVAQGHGQGDPRILKFDRRGALLASWGGKGSAPGRFDIAHSIVVDEKGTVYVADRQNRRVQLFRPDGTFIESWTFAGLPCGLSIGADGQMYLVSGFAGQILRLDPRGRTLAATGQPGKGLGEFGEAHYLAFGANGEIYVADTVNARLHKFVKRAG